MQNPFDAPGNDHLRQAGELSAGQAVSTAISALGRNFWQCIGLFFIAFFTYIVSVCTCVGWIYALPVMMWGFTAWTLRAVDGVAPVSSLWEAALADPVRPWLSMGGLLLCSILIFLPVAILGGGLSFLMQSQEAPQAALIGIGSQVFGVTYVALLARFNLAMWFLVDSGEGPVEAFTRSWNETRGQWLSVAALTLAWGLGNMPVAAINGIIASSIAPNPGTGLPEMSIFLPAYAAQMAMGLLSSALYIIYAVSCAALYRQLYPAQSPTSTQAVNPKLRVD